MKSTLGKRLASLILCASMVLSMLPAVAAAAGIVVKVTPETLELVKGQKETLSTVVEKDGQPVQNAQVMYTSSEPTKVKVDPATGQVEALEEAIAPVIVKAIYTAEDQTAYEGQCSITVKAPIPVEKVTITANMGLTQEVGAEGLRLTELVIPTTATDKSVTWNSKDTSVATVASDGTVKLVGPGKSIVTATASNGVESNALEIIVSGLRMRDSLELLTGQSETLAAPGFGNAEKKTVEWSSSNISVAEVKAGRVSAYNPGTAVITARVGKYKATCTVTVKEDVASAISGSMVAGETLHFSKLTSDLENRAREQISARLEYITSLAVAPNQGILYYGYSSPDAPGSGVGGSERFYVHASAGQMPLSSVVFVPNSDFGGTATISYMGQGEGKTFSGSIRIEIENSGDVAYNTAEDRVLSLDAATFASTFQKKTGRALSYVTFQLPQESRGTLYYNYSTTQFSQLVSDGARYYVSGGSMQLDQVSFLPAKGYTGTVTIPYHGYDTAGVSYSGKVTITVYADKHDNVDDVTYRTSSGASVRFDADDLQNACRAATGSSLNYIYLTLPSASQGRLYYKYVSSGNYGGLVNDSTRYFRSSSPGISQIDFVANQDFVGTVTIPYTGYSSTGERFEGDIKIRVGNQTDVIRYSTSHGRAIDFNGLDFDESCTNSNGARLEYVKFELPSSREGTLYHNYREHSSANSTVSTSTRYYRSNISNITFVPNRSFSGVVSIPYSGYDVRGDRYSGTVKITVDQQQVDETIRYSTVSGGVAAFNTEDFNRVCRSLTGDNLDYVNFTLPSSREGKLYYDYDHDRNRGSTVSSSTNYYRGGSSRLLDDVVFVADQNCTDTVYINYTGRSTGGRSFDGTITIDVTRRYTNGILQTTSALPLRFQTSWFQNASANGLPSDLSYIQFKTLPSSIYGKVVENFYQPNRRAEARTDRSYYRSGSPSIDSLAFVPKAGYQGTVTITYTAVDSRGNSIEGKMEIQVSNSYLNSRFADVGRHGWAVPSIEFLYDYGVIKGYSSTQYGPGDQTSRGAFVMMVCKLFGFQLHSGPTGFRDVSADNIFAPAITAGRNLGIISGYDGLFHPDAPITREQAMVVLEKAMQVAGWQVSGASTAVLNMYADGRQVSDFARSAVASMVRMGIISGDDRGNLNPKQPISRAEIAVVLHKLLTR